MFTVVIPIFNLTEERLRNFYIILNYLQESHIKPLIVEQFSPKLVNLIDYDVDYLQVPSKSTLIEKSKLINKALLVVSTKYFWLLDADVFLDYKLIIEQIKDQDVIMPFKTVIRLNPEDTIQFIKTGNVTFKKNQTRTEIDDFGPLSFIIKTNIFKNIKMDETFIGWGWEDLDFANKVKEKYKIDIIDTVGLHLYHPVEHLNEPTNRQHYIEKHGSH